MGWRVASLRMYHLVCYRAQPAAAVSVCMLFEVVRQHAPALASLRTAFLVKDSSHHSHPLLFHSAYRFFCTNLQRYHNALCAACVLRCFVQLVLFQTFTIHSLECPALSFMLVVAHNQFSEAIFTNHAYIHCAIPSAHHSIHNIPRYG